MDTLIHEGLIRVRWAETPGNEVEGLEAIATGVAGIYSVESAEVVREAVLREDDRAGLVEAMRTLDSVVGRIMHVAGWHPAAVGAMEAVMPITTLAHEEVGGL